MTEPHLPGIEDEPASVLQPEPGAIQATEAANSALLAERFEECKRAGKHQLARLDLPEGAGMLCERAVSPVVA